MWALLPPSTVSSSKPYLIELGDHVTFSDRVSLVTHDGAVWVFREKEANIELVGRITSRNNVFVGLNATALYGTKTRDNSIVAAGEGRHASVARCRVVVQACRVVAHDLVDAESSLCAASLPAEDSVGGFRRGMARHQALHPSGRFRPQGTPSPLVALPVQADRGAPPISATIA